MKKIDRKKSFLALAFVDGFRLRRFHKAVFLMNRIKAQAVRPSQCICRWVAGGNIGRYLLT